MCTCLGTCSAVWGGAQKHIAQTAFPLPFFLVIAAPPPDVPKARCTAPAPLPSNCHRCSPAVKNAGDGRSFTRRDCRQKKTVQAPSGSNEPDAKDEETRFRFLRFFGGGKYGSSISVSVRNRARLLYHLFGICFAMAPPTADPAGSWQKSILAYTGTKSIYLRTESITELLQTIAFLT